MIMDEGEIVREYKAAKNHREQVKVLAELNSVSTKAMAIFLQDHGCAVDKRYLQDSRRVVEQPPYGLIDHEMVDVEPGEQYGPAIPEEETAEVPEHKPVDPNPTACLKVYIAGPITGNDKAREQFLAVQKWLEGLGFVTVNPIKNIGPTYRDYINQGFRQLMTCNMICLIPGWMDSDGAMLEHIYAETVGMPELMIPEKLWRKWEVS